ncbi:hypothetical protein [Neisseria meningitidis]|uniref:hypothetical protein n=1 Tax=Neisseria meningitidis TaxID=487 RepID=UPI000E581E6B|nr:hypothetical protein [Neisseria meningitidis]
MSEIINLTESGITFNLVKNNLFYIEPYIRKRRQEGIKTVEFIYLQEDNLLFVEAKQSIPNQERSPERFDEYISEIYQKWCNALNVEILGILGREDIKETIMPSAFSNLQWGSIEIKLLLVIPDVPLNYLGQLNELIKQEFNKKDTLRLISLWNISVEVINRDLAIQKGLVSS